MNYAELARRLENLCRHGTVETIDYEKQRITVNLGDIITDEIRWVTLRSGENKTWDPPSIGEECAVISPCGELKLGFAIFGFYNEDNPAPSNDPNTPIYVFKDGCILSYNAESHHLTAHLPSGGTANITADVTINGKLHVTKAITAGEDISTPKDVKAASISLRNHKHGNVQSGQSDTGSPK